MKRTILAGTVLATMTAAALAAGGHAGGHGDAAKGHDNADGHHETMAVGKPGRKADVRRTVQVTMKETDGGDMVFRPSSLTVKQGETIRFVVTNVGELEHEFVLDTHDNVIEHKALMEKFPEMEHDDPNAVRLEPGKKGEIIWTFTNSGSFEFACLIPGHYEAGMKGTLTVGAK